MKINRSHSIDPFSIIVILVLIVLIPKYMGGDNFRAPYSIPSGTTTQGQDVYKTRLEALTRELTLSKTINYPTQLFDISLKIANPLLDKSSDLVASVDLFSFGTEPTLVDLVYKVLDVRGKEVYRENNKVIVETEQVLSKSFPNLSLRGGKYTLVLDTTYGDNIQDEFKQSFEVKVLPDSIKVILIILTIAVIAVAIGRSLARKKKR